MTTSRSPSPSTSPRAWRFQPLGIVPLDEMPREIPGPVVPEPVEGIVPEGVGAGQVHVAVAIQIAGGDAIGVGVTVLDQVLRESGRLRPERSCQEDGCEDEGDNAHDVTVREDKVRRQLGYFQRALLGDRHILTSLLLQTGRRGKGQHVFSVAGILAEVFSNRVRPTIVTLAGRIYLRYSVLSARCSIVFLNPVSEWA